MTGITFKDSLMFKFQLPPTLLFSLGEIYDH